MNVPPVLAAGGHHAVEDAALPEPGKCEVETWVDREKGGGRELAHIGPACRFGAVEIGLNLDREHLRGSGTTTVAGAQLKWARTIGDGWSGGFVVAVEGQDHSAGYLGSTIVIPITWQVADNLLTHLAIGRDFTRGQPDTSRSGFAVEWAPLTAWSFVAERFRESGASFWRAGLRWTLSPSISIDLGHAQMMNSSAPAWWTLGLNWVFDR